MLWLDLETRSQIDIKKHGLSRYAQDLSTQVICMAYAIGSDPVQCWFAEDGEFPKAVIDYIKTGGPLVAHNAAFERALFDYVIANDYDFTPPALTQWRCSSAWAMAHGLPASLGDICRAVKLPIQKQKEGSRLIRDYCAPGFLTEWKGGDKELMRDYCVMDVETMRLFCSGLRELTAEEWSQYHITESINDRGVPVDTAFAAAALEYAESVRHDIGHEIAAITGGRMTKATQRKERDFWLAENLPPELLDLITVDKTDTKGEPVKKIKFDKEYRGILASHPDTPEHVAKFVDLIEQAGGSTISKYSSIVETHINGRVHGSLIWNGAGTTGRYSSRGLQLQNFRRDTYKEPQPIIDAIKTNAPLDRPAETLGRLIRSVITSPAGLTYSDYSQIEARVLPWLSGDKKAEKVLDIFREGRDLYSENALYMFHVERDQVTPDLRQAAKQGVLACGFGGGARAVQAMAKGYGLKYNEDQANEIKTAWRAANPWAEPFWHAVKQAAKWAYCDPGETTHAGRLSFRSDGRDYVWMRLPSGRFIAYLQPRIEVVEYPWGEEGFELTCLWGSAKPKVGEKWPRRTLNHLILSENATQGTAADIMREAIVRAHKAGLPVLFSVHDELVIEGQHEKQLHDIMTTPPAWATGLPIDAETQEADRYGK